MISASLTDPEIFLGSLEFIETPSSWQMVFIQRFVVPPGALWVLKRPKHSMAPTSSVASITIIIDSESLFPCGLSHFALLAFQKGLRS